MFEYYGNTHIYCPRVGQMSPWSPILFSESLKFSPTAQWPRFIYTLKYISHQCFMPNFVEIGPPVPEIFERFLTILFTCIYRLVPLSIDASYKI